MSQANIPNITPDVSITRDDAINLGLASIAMGEMGLSHILNAEGEKIQYMLGTLPGLSGPPATISDLLAVNQSVRKTLGAINNQEFILSSKLDSLKQVISLSEATGVTGPIGPTGVQGPIGPTGVQGLIGPTGLQGPIGPTGMQGLIGPTGLQGPIGPTGTQGLIGPTGIQGPIGPTGPTESLSAFIGYGGAHLDNLSPGTPSTYGIISTSFTQHISTQFFPGATINVVQNLMPREVRYSSYEMPYNGKIRTLTSSAYYVESIPALAPGNTVTYYIEIYQAGVGMSTFTRIPNSKFAFSPAADSNTTENDIFTLDASNLDFEFVAGDRLLFIQYAEANTSLNETEITFNLTLGVGYTN